MRTLIVECDGCDAMLTARTLAEARASGWWLHTSDLCPSCASAAGRPTLPYEVGRLVAETARAHRLGVADILGRNRSGPVSMARRDVCLVLREAGYTYEAIGRWLGRDHSTIQAYCKRRLRA